jgi:hypothetical protein
MQRSNTGSIAESRGAIPRDDGLNTIRLRVRLDDKPKYHVDHVHEPNGLQCQRMRYKECRYLRRTYAVKVQTITKHELPRAKSLDSK